MRNFRENQTAGRLAAGLTLLLFGGCSGVEENPGAGGTAGSAIAGKGGSAGTGSSVAGSGTSSGGAGGSAGSGQAGSAPGCGAGQTLCGTTCVNLVLDPANCGACGAVCSAGQACNAGACSCATRQSECGGGCVDTSANATHCGACDNTCSAGQQCAGGACACQAGLQACGATCADLSGDGANCGACGNACAAGQVCSAGVCGASCGGGLTQCGASCVDLTNNAQHCGVCGATCPAGRACAAGSCGCGGGQTACGDRCVDTTNDSANCGSCGNQCAVGQICRSGACSCPTGQTNCNGSCADTNLSLQHCGACDNACDMGQACTQGSCTCPQGQMSCGGGCVDATTLQTDRENCGTCGNACPAGQICSAGQCTGSSGSCSGASATSAHPFGCELAWGANGNTGNRSSYLDYITSWVGYETDGGLSGTCDGCTFAKGFSGATPVYYAYFIGYQAAAAGFGDCNTDADGQNLCTRGAQWVKSNRDRIVQMYANYARLTYQAVPSKAVVWLLEGDFIQYTYAEQSSPLGLSELGTLANDIICAIKANQPNAVVAINHSPWITNEQMNQFWGAMPLNVTDFVWTTGVGNNDGFITNGTTASSYNGTTARYAYLSDLTGKEIFVDTSFGASQAADSWSNQNAATLNSRIGEGVMAVNVTEPPGDYQTRISGLASQLSDVCQ